MLLSCCLDCSWNAFHNWNSQGLALSQVAVLIQAARKCICWDRERGVGAAVEAWVPGSRRTPGFWKGGMCLSLLEQGTWHLGCWVLLGVSGAWSSSCAALPVAAGRECRSTWELQGNRHTANIGQSFSTKPGTPQPACCAVDLCWAPLSSSTNSALPGLGLFLSSRVMHLPCSLRLIRLLVG